MQLLETAQLRDTVEIEAWKATAKPQVRRKLATSSCKPYVFMSAVSLDLSEQKCNDGGAGTYIFAWSVEL